MSITQTVTRSDEAPANVDAIIGENIHRLMWRANDRQTVIADRWGMTQSALSLKLRGKRPWFAGEIDAAARHYGVSRDSLFKKLPDLDSNQEPIGFKSKYIGMRRPVDELAQHRKAKEAAHKEVEYRRGFDAVG